MPCYTVFQAVFDSLLLLNSYTYRLFDLFFVASLITSLVPRAGRFCFVPQADKIVLCGEEVVLHFFIGTRAVGQPKDSPLRGGNSFF